MELFWSLILARECHPLWERQPYPRNLTESWFNVLTFCDIVRIWAMNVLCPKKTSKKTGFHNYTMSLWRSHFLRYHQNLSDESLGTRNSKKRSDWIVLFSLSGFTALPYIYQYNGNLVWCSHMSDILSVLQLELFHNSTESLPNLTIQVWMFLEGLHFLFP